MNAPANGAKRSTPRTVRDIFLDKLKAARRYYDQANEIQAEFTAPENVLRFGSERAAFIACAQDIRWQEAVENEKFAERLANMYGQASILQELEAHRHFYGQLISELKHTNNLLRQMLERDG